MEVKIEDGKLHIIIEMIDPPEVSASGKSFVIASSHGNVTTNTKVDGKNIVVGINAYVKREPK
jgi:hypothetical protein